MDAKKEAARLQLKIGGLGLATVIRDQENKLHVVPGCELEIIGVYTTGIKRADLQDDIEFIQESKR